MKTILTSIALAAVTATSAMAFDADSTMNELLLERDAAYHLLEIKADWIGYANADPIAAHEEYQWAKVDFKSDFYNIAGSAPIEIAGSRVLVRELPALIDAELAAIADGTRSALGLAAAAAATTGAIAVVAPAPANAQEIYNAHFEAGGTASDLPASIAGLSAPEIDALESNS